MGCTGSVKVAPVQPPDLHEDESLHSKTSRNTIRGDRLSIVDARARREEESKNRLRRLSSLQPDEVNRVRRNSSRMSSHSSTKASNSFNPLPEEDQIYDNTQPRMDSKKAKETRNKIRQITTLNKNRNSTDSGRESTDIEKDSSCSSECDQDECEEKSSHNNRKKEKKHKRNKNSIKSYSNQEPVVDLVVPFKSSDSYEEIGKIDFNHDLKTQKRSMHYRAEGDGKTDSPFAVDVHEQYPNTREDPLLLTRQSVDSLKLKTDANHFVNDIMAQALHLVEKDSKRSQDDKQTVLSRHNILHNDDESKLCSIDENKSRNVDETRIHKEGDTISVDSAIMNEQAKGIVGNALSNALLVLNSNKSTL